MFGIEWLLCKRLALYALAGLVSLLTAIAIEIPPGNGGRNHLRFLAWIPVLVWFGFLTGGLCKAFGASYLCQDIIIASMVTFSIILSLLFLLPILKALLGSRMN